MDSELFFLQKISVSLPVSVRQANFCINAEHEYIKMQMMMNDDFI